MRTEDILAAIREIQSFVADMDFDGFRRDTKTLKAVIADFIIIGEAAAGMPPEIVSAHPQVPWALMRGMRNTLVHAYFDVDPRILWDTVQQDLGGLVPPQCRMFDPA